MITEQYAEPSLRVGGSKNGQTFRDVDLMLFDKVIVFRDHYRQKLILITGVRTSDLEASYRQAEAELDEMERLLDSGAKADFRPLILKEELKPYFSREKYSEMVERAKNYIREGDIFQVVLSDPLGGPGAGQSV